MQIEGQFHFALYSNLIGKSYSNLIGKSKKTVLAGAHKKFECCQHTEMYLLVLKAQDEGKMKLPLDLHGVWPNWPV